MEKDLKEMSNAELRVRRLRALEDVLRYETELRNRAAEILTEIQNDEAGF